MKYFILKKIANYLKKYKKIFAIERVEDRIIKINFDKREILYFDMKKSNGYIFKKKEFLRAKNYQAPFDIVLKKIFTNSIIKNVEVEEGNRILKIEVEATHKYKKDFYTLQFEFTGRNTNVIILDKDEVVQEAMRHISISNSFREVKVGNRLLPLPPKEIKEKSFEIENIEEYLYQVYQEREKLLLEQFKKQKISQTDKKIQKLQKELEKIKNPQNLLEEAEKLTHKANLLLTNIYKIKPYQKRVKIKNFEGVEEEITIPQEAKSVTNGIDIFFNRAKKLRQKAKNNHIEKENLEDKINFLNSLKNIIKNAKSYDELSIYFPKKSKNRRERVIDNNIEVLFFENYKILIGKNQKGNEKLLKEAKKNDIWFHLKDRPSCHLIIKTDKQNIKESIIEFASKLCVEFSVNESGKYEVDYTTRKNVKIVKNANVNYVNYKTKIVNI